MATVTSSTSKFVCFFLFQKYTSIPNLKRIDQELPAVELSKENLDFFSWLPWQRLVYPHPNL